MNSNFRNGVYNYIILIVCKKLICTTQDEIFVYDPRNFKNIVQNISRENIHMMMVFSVVKKILEHNSMMYAPGLGQGLLQYNMKK